MFAGPQVLPIIEDQEEGRKRKTGGKLVGQESRSSSSGCSSAAALEQDDQNQNQGTQQAGTTSSIDLFRLPPLVVGGSQTTNTKSQLAASTLAAGATLPLMIGNRSRCVVNLVEEKTMADGILKAQVAPKQTSVSVVRPVVHLEPHRHHCPLHSKITTNQPEPDQANSSMLDHLMELERRASRLSSDDIQHRQLQTALNQLELSSGTSLQTNPAAGRQQMALFRREELELNRHVRRQHRFFVGKLEERRRSLRILHQVWLHQDLKRAIERLVDIYSQGLVFDQTTSTNYDEYNKTYKQTQLSSLNSWLVVDMLGQVLLPRPKLWSLEVCQLLLPIVVNDLLQQPHQNYVETALAAMKLVLTHFGPLIATTLADTCTNLKPVGVDLNREERQSKCANCRKLLEEARQQLAKWRPSRNLSNPGKLMSQRQELERIFENFFNDHSTSSHFNK